MKKENILLFICLLLALSIQAQSLSLSNENGSVPNNSDLYISGDLTVFELLCNVSFTNNSTGAIDVGLKKTELSIISGHLNTFEYAGFIFPPNIYISPFQVNLLPGNTNNEFVGHLYHNDVIGESIIRYTFYDFSNPDDSICVNVHYQVSDDEPLLTGIIPDEATIPDELTVEISGSYTHFTMGTGTTVWLSSGSNSIYSSWVNEINDSILQAQFLFSNTKVPDVYDVYTHNYVDGELNLPDAFTLNLNPNPPYLETVEPPSAAAGQMITLVITGGYTNFTQGVDYAYLFSNNTWLTDYSITIVSDEQIEVEIPITSGVPSGLYSLKVKTDWDGTMYLYDVFTVEDDPSPQFLTDITPDTGTIPENLSVTISGNGTHFMQATGTIVKFRQGSSTIYPWSVTEISNTEVTAEFSFDNFDNPGFYDVNTYNAVDGDLFLDNGFYLNPNPNPPQIVSVEPDSALQGETLQVAISGQNTNFTQGTGTIVWLKQDFYIINPYSTTVVNDELINASFQISDDALSSPKISLQVKK
ncbi:MAG: hypothetical protein K9G76_12505 [Bacteroidales bacterium]|nr:hypothetical protein [Bacteroidales bacterium]MCF8405426.1 hypothetical protein [Bacteroidales bacterium]